MRQQTNSLSATLPKCAALFEQFDSARAEWKIVQFAGTINPADVTADKMRIVKPLINRSLDKPAELVNSFPSRTAALRMSERALRAEYKDCRSEKGSWGAWLVKPEGKPSFWQSVVPFAIVVEAAEKEASKPADKPSAPNKPATANKP